MASVPRQSLSRQHTSTIKRSNNPCLVVLSDREKEHRRRLKSYNYVPQSQEMSTKTKTQKLSCAIQALQCSSRAEQYDKIDLGYHQIGDKYSQFLLEDEQKLDFSSLQRPEARKDRQKQRLYLSSSEPNREMVHFLKRGNTGPANSTTTSGPVIANFADFACAAALEAASNQTLSSTNEHTLEKQVKDSAHRNGVDGPDLHAVVGSTSSGSMDMVLVDETQGKRAGLPLFEQNESKDYLTLSPVSGSATTEDCGDTPTTCNRSLVAKADATPLGTLEAQYKGNADGIIGQFGQEKDGDSSRDGRPPRQMLHHSLALGDALSPNEEETPSMEPTINLVTSNIADERIVLFSRDFQNDHLKLPDMGDRSERALINQGKKLQNNEHTGHHSNCQLNNSKEKKICDDDSFTSVSSFATTSVDGQARSKNAGSESSKSAPVSRKPENIGNRSPTVHPFFWKTHPTVTFKSYHFYQPKPRVRRVVPNLERVLSIDTQSTAGHGIDFLPSFMPFSGEGSHISDGEITPEQEAYSLYMHPAAVRLLYVDSPSRPTEQTTNKHSAEQDTTNVFREELES